MKHLAYLLRRLANGIDPQTAPARFQFAGAFNLPERTVPFLPLEERAWWQLSKCLQADRVADRVRGIMTVQGLTAWSLADKLTEHGFPVSAQDITDLRLGMRHLRGDTELAALARVLRVESAVLTAPDGAA